MTIVLKTVLRNCIDNKHSRIGFGLLILLMCFSFTPPAVGGQDAKSLFSSAQSGFETALKASGEKRRMLMIKAAGQFQALIGDHGIENGHLYYNMGNAYFEAGDIGKAILSYRRAEKLMPGSTDLQYNLKQARSQLNVQVSEKNWTETVVRGLGFWHTMLSYELRRNLFFIAFVFTWVVLILMIFRRHIFLRSGLILMIMLSIGFGGSYLLSYYHLHGVAGGVITTDDSTARKGPGDSYESFYQTPLPGGTEFILKEMRERWWKVRLSGGDDVWIQRNDAGLI